MLEKIIVRFTLFLLNSKRISGEQKSLVTSALLDNLMAIPIKDMIVLGERYQVSINGQELSPEQARSFRESALAFKNNPARKVIRDQMRFKAISFGVHQALNPDMMIFSKAALWYDQEEDKLLSTVAVE